MSPLGHAHTEFPDSGLGFSVPKTLAELARDERGFIISMELILIMTILVIGLIAGLTALRDAVVSELSDVARSIQETNQSYETGGTSSPSASQAGSAFSDRSDSFGGASADQCIVVFGPADE